ncbi:MAG TPA: hypothetical protein VFH68_23335 [Polyangia bacterium]|jgi:hypothetical protein|nr:hypothetical protein [Polyangia bacterium]
MSENEHGKEPHGKESEDNIDFTKVIAVGVISLVTFAVATWWAISILHGERARFKGREEARVGSDMGKTEIGIVDQVPFSKDERLQVWKIERAEWLANYNWVDRAHGIVTMPIERAMDAVVAGAIPPPSATSGTPPPPAAGHQ